MALHCLVRMQDRLTVISRCKSAIFSRTDVELLPEEILLPMQAGLTISPKVYARRRLYTGSACGSNCGFTEFSPRGVLVRKAFEIGAAHLSGARLRPHSHPAARQPRRYFGRPGRGNCRGRSHLVRRGPARHLGCRRLSAGVSCAHLVSIHNRGAPLEELFQYAARALWSTGFGRL